MINFICAKQSVRTALPVARKSISQIRMLPNDEVTLSATAMKKSEKSSLKKGFELIKNFISKIFNIIKNFFSSKETLSPQMIQELNKLVEKGTVSKETVVLMKELLEFGNPKDKKNIYQILTKHMKIKNPPELVSVNRQQTFVYNPNKGTISLSEDANIGIMFHELTHFDQFQKVYRAFGKEAMIEAQVTQRLNILKSNPRVALNELGKTFGEATQKEIDEFATKTRNKLNSDFNEDFYKKVAEANGELTSEERLQAQKYLDAMKKPDHNSSIIEHEAYQKQIKFEDELREINKIISN